MPTVLITGASRGLGREFARSYAQDGWDVLAVVRNQNALKDTPDFQDIGRVLTCDVTDPKSVRRLAESLSSQPIDLLINNAGVLLDENTPLGNFDFDLWEKTFRVNTIAPMRVVQALIKSVAESGKKLMVFISSRSGSISENDGGSYAYRSSKAALNMAVSCLAIELKPMSITCLIFHPGWVRTDMGGSSAPITARESVSGMRSVIDRSNLSSSGKFYNYKGDIVGW